MKPYEKRRKLQRQLSIAEYINLCDDALSVARRRANGQWPDSVTVPLWPGGLERHALVRWMDETNARAGKTIRIEFEPPLSLREMSGSIGRLH
jgi:hypothetical protein